MNKTTTSKFLCHGYYVLFGVVGIGILPGLVKTFEDAFGLSHASMGLVMGLASIAFAIGCMGGGVMFDRRGGRTTMCWSIGLSALFALAILFSPAAAAFIAALLLFHVANGMGQVVNPMVVRLYGTRQTQGINLLHGFQGVGRLLAPLLIAACFTLTGTWRTAFIVSAALFGLWLVLFFIGPKDAPPADSFEDGNAKPDTRHSEPSAVPRTGALTDPPVLLVLLGFAFLSGAESIILNWTPNFLESEAHFAKSEALLGLSFIMLGYVAIRGLLGMREAGSVSRFIPLSTVPLLLGMMGLTHARGSAAAYALCFVVGVSAGAYFPSHAAALLGYCPRAQGVLSGWCNVMSVAGGGFFVWLTGWLGDRIGLQRSLLLAPACAGVFAVTYTVFIISTTRPQVPNPNDQSNTKHQTPMINQ